MAKTSAWSARKTAKAIDDILSSAFTRVKRGYWGEMRRPGFEVVAQGDRVEVRYWTMAAAQNPDSEVNDWLAKYKQVLEDRLPAADHAIQFSGRGYATPCILVSSRN